VSKIDLTGFYVGKLLDIINSDETLKEIKYSPKTLDNIIKKSFKFTELQYICLLNDIEDDLFKEFEEYLIPRNKAA